MVNSFYCTADAKSRYIWVTTVEWPTLTFKMAAMWKQKDRWIQKTKKFKQNYRKLRIDENSINWEDSCKVARPGEGMQNREFPTQISWELEPLQHTFMLSLPKPIPMQLLLYKTTTCLMQSATTFFVPQRKKTLSKTTTVKLHPAKIWEVMHKNKLSLWLYLLYYYLIMQSLFDVYKSWIFTFKIGLPNYPFG